MMEGLARSPEAAAPLASKLLPPAAGFLGAGACALAALGGGVATGVLAALASGALVWIAGAVFATRRRDEIRNATTLLSAYLEGRGDVPSVAQQRPLGAVGALALELEAHKRELSQALARAQGQLQQFAARAERAAREYREGGGEIEEAVEESASLLAHINASIKSINGEVDRLLASAQEVGSSILEMGAAIDEVARGAALLHGSAETTTSTVHELSASVRQVAENASSVQGMAEESAASMVEMDRAIQEVSRHVREAAQLTEQVSHGAHEGARAVEETIHGIEDIRTQTLSAKGVLEALAQRIVTIGEFVNVISGINEETNLLSLNAAIIAAQAGEQGKAFAVVANHVKTLAQRTASSTREIEGLIGAVQSASHDATRAMSAGIEAVERGVVRSRRAGVELGRIKDSARQASERVNEIARASDEQTRNSKHVAEAAQRTSTMVQQISEAIGEQSRASETMLEAAQTALDQCSQVHRSTEEQRETSRFIRARTEAITEMIRTIQANAESHGAASESVSEAVNRILDIAKRKNALAGELLSPVERDAPPRP
jgi:methyl-accepting chemotaxis protein